MKIGFLDSGIGGLTVLHETLNILPHEDYIFYADTFHAPYGDKPKEEVRDYIFKAVAFLAQQGVKALVIACNTATSIAVDDLRLCYDFPILGIEPAVKPAVQSCKSRQKKVLVMATPLTLQEEKFHHLVRRLDYPDRVDSVALPGLVAFAERDEFHEDQVIPYLQEKLASFDVRQYGTVVLGCTHFPFFEDSIQKVFPEDVAIISGNRGTAKHLKRMLETKNEINEGTGNITFFQSGHPIEATELLTRQVQAQLACQVPTQFRHYSDN